jgi:hypothetical protein
MIPSFAFEAYPVESASAGLLDSAVKSVYPSKQLVSRFRGVVGWLAMLQAYNLVGVEQNEAQRGSADLLQLQIARTSL